MLKCFNGGVGQIAIHGSGTPGRIGRPSSFGCVILGDAPLRDLVRTVGPGTPVVITRR